MIDTWDTVQEGKAEKERNTMKLFVLLFACLSAAQAQKFTLAASPQSVRIGQSINLTVGFVQEPEVQLVAASWFLSPSQFNALSPTGATLGPAAAAAGKSSACSTSMPYQCFISTPDTTHNNVIASGALVTTSYTISQSTKPGLLTIALVGGIGAGKNGVGVPLPSPSITITVLPAFTYDVDGDGSVTSTDVLGAIDQMLGVRECTTGDVDGNGKCDVIDVLLTALAALKLI